MSEITDYTKLVPTEPPEDIVNWLYSEDYFKMEYLVYKVGWVKNPLTEKKERMVELRCSGCGQAMYAEYVPAPSCSRATSSFGFRHPETNEALCAYKNTLCPMCGCEAATRHVSDMYNMYDDAYPMTLSRIDEKLVLTGWCIRRRISRDCETRFEKHPYEAYVLDGKTMLRLCGYMKNMSGSISFFDSWEQRKRFDDTWGQAACVYPWDKQLLIGSNAENSALDRYMKDAKLPYPITYLRLWQRYPQAENLVVQGYGRFLGELILKTAGGYSGSGVSANKIKETGTINWKEKRPGRMLGLNREELRCFKKQKWNPEELTVYRLARDSGERIMPEEMEDIRKEPIYSVKRFTDGYPGELARAIRYLKKQRDKYKGRNIDLLSLQDYWEMARQLGYNVNENRYPKNLEAAHDRVLAEVKARKDAENFRREKKIIRGRASKFRARREELAKFAWEEGEFFIRACPSEMQLKREGRLLSHCVATYAQEHLTSSSAIFFIRRKAEPRKPLFTLQLNLKTLDVIQNRGKKNCARTTEITEFELHWLAWVRESCAAQTKKKNKKEVKVA